MIVIAEKSFPMSKKSGGEMNYTVARNWFNPEELQVIVTAVNAGGGKRVETVMTKKSDEEIIEFFEQKFKEYKPKVEKQWFFLKAIPLTRFDRELVNFLGTPLEK